MKRICLLLFAAMLLVVNSYGQKKKVAVVSAVGPSVSQDIRMGISSGLQQGIFNSGQYTLLSRGAAFEKALSEMKFQQSGAVSDDQLTEFGHAAGADYVGYAMVVKYSEKDFLINYKMIDVASGEVVRMGTETVTNGVEGLLTATTDMSKNMFDGSGNSSNGSNPPTPQRHPAEPDLVFVQGGTFWMGCSGEQGSDCYEGESPLHSVTLSSYYMSKYVVTQKQWQLIMGTTVRQQRDKVSTSYPICGEGDNYPMYYVSWDEAQEFIRRLNAATGKQYRLPTEAEWEYAARGGNKSQGYKYSGSNNLNDVGWYHSVNSGNTTHPVGAMRPNELGIYDMSGNVWEWCQDWYGTYPSSPQRDPQGPSSGSFRVLRGGSWSNDARYARVSNRSNLTPDGRDPDLGFHLACSSN